MMLSAPFYTPASLARELADLDISVDLIREAIRAGHLPYSQPGGTGKRIIRREDAIAWLDPEQLRGADR